MTRIEHVLMHCKLKWHLLLAQVRKLYQRIQVFLVLKRKPGFATANLLQTRNMYIPNEYHARTRSDLLDVSGPSSHNAPPLCGAQVVEECGANESKLLYLELKPDVSIFNRLQICRASQGLFSSGRTRKALTSSPPSVSTLPPPLIKTNSW